MSRAGEIFGAVDLWFKDENIPLFKNLKDHGYDTSTREKAIKIVATGEQKEYKNTLTWLKSVSDTEYEDFHNKFIDEKFPAANEIEELARDIEDYESQAMKYEGTLKDEMTTKMKRVIQEYLKEDNPLDIKDRVLELGRKSGPSLIREFKKKLEDISVEYGGGNFW